MKAKFVILFLAISFAAILPAEVFGASTLYFSPASGTYETGKTFSISLFVNTGGRAINAASADIFFDKAKLNVSSLSVASSIFTTWVEYPSFSNTDGKIHFSGGLPSPGYSGTLGKLITITFESINQGKAAISTGSQQIFLDDGNGTQDFGSATGGSYAITSVRLSASCAASPSLADVGDLVKFTASAQGGEGNYSYAWSGDCKGNLKACQTPFNLDGKKKATVTVKSGDGQTAFASCSANIVYPGLKITCLSPESADVNSNVSFSATSSGGNGQYSYTWSGACQGDSPQCDAIFGDPGLKKARVDVVSDGRQGFTECPVYIIPACPLCTKEKNPICPIVPQTITKITEYFKNLSWGVLNIILFVMLISLFSTLLLLSSKSKKIKVPRKKIAVILLVILASAFCKTVNAENQPPVFRFAPESQQIDANQAVDALWQMNPGKNNVCAISGTLKFVNLSCQKIVVAPDIVVQAAPTCQNPNFAVGIPGCDLKDKNIFSATVKGVKNGKAKLSVTDAKVYGVGKEIVFDSYSGSYQILGAKAGVAQSLFQQLWNSFKELFKLLKK